MALTNFGKALWPISTLNPPSADWGHAAGSALFRVLAVTGKGASPPIAV